MEEYYDPSELTPLTHIFWESLRSLYSYQGISGDISWLTCSEEEKGLGRGFFYGSAHALNLLPEYGPISSEFGLEKDSLAAWLVNKYPNLLDTLLDTGKFEVWKAREIKAAKQRGEVLDHERVPPSFTVFQPCGEYTYEAEWVDLDGPDFFAINVQGPATKKWTAVVLGQVLEDTYTGSMYEGCLHATAKTTDLLRSLLGLTPLLWK